MITGVHYLTIEGPGDEEIAQLIREAMPSYSEDELLAWWDRAAEANDIDDKVDAVLFMGVGSPSTVDEEIVKRIRAALGDPDKDVRNAAIVATGYADWPIFEADLQAIAEGDAGETARKRAEVVLDSWKPPARE